MKLIQMRYFQKVCEFNNITRASEVLFVSQPAISAAIRELEQEFNVRLFNRINNKLQLTEEGSIFLDQVNEIIEKVDRLEDQMNLFSITANMINIGIPPMIGELIFPYIFHDFRNLYPSMQLNIVECGSLQVIDLVKNKKIDIGFGIINDVNESQLEHVRILKTQLVYAVHPRHPLSKMKEIDYTSLDQESLVIMKEDSFQNIKLKEIFESKQIHPKIVLYSNQLNTIKKILSNGDVGAFIMKEIADSNPDMVGIPLKEPIQIDIGLIWQKKHPYNKLINRFIELTLNYYKDVT